MHVYFSVAQTFRPRHCSLQNCALARDILKKSVFFRSKKRDFAVKVVLLEGVVSELVEPLIFENRVPVRDILKFLSFSFSMIHQKLRSRARQFNFFAFVIFLSSKIALSCGVFGNYCVLDHLHIFKNCAPVRSILRISSIYLHRIRSK